MNPTYEFSAAVRVVRTIRNDGTFPGKRRGELLIRRGAIGFVREFGVFLQDQMIYQVHFLEQDITVGCREQELVAADAPWIDSVYEFGDWVAAVHGLSVRGELVVQGGDIGQVMTVRRDLSPIRYEVLFGDRLLQVPLEVLRWPLAQERTHGAEVQA